MCRGVGAAHHLVVLGSSVTPSCVHVSGALPAFNAARTCARRLGHPFGTLRRSFVRVSFGNTLLLSLIQRVN